ncbi:transcriptional regulator, GntR family [Variovorax sp. YR216]|nr:transcriptional regulator, GntR family [Variovorax sp. YR216]
MVAVEKALLRGEGAHASPPVAEQIAARLAGLIALDLLPPGQRLFETDISEMLRVSRAPVREAIRILERDHLVELSARRGAAVTAPDARELQDIFEVRVALFSILLEQVMKERHADLLRVFGQHLPRLEKAAGETPQAFAVQSFLFNLDVADLCSNRLVVDQLKAISLRTLRYVRLGLSAAPEAVTKAMGRWRTLHNAVVKGDTALAIECATKRISAVRDLTVSALRKSRPATHEGRKRSTAAR